MIAIGAPHRVVMGKALRSGFEPVVIGACAGLIATVLLARTLESYLMGISGVDPATYAATFVAFLLCAAVVGVTAALRLRRISPMEVLRSE
jgi:ABC-type antimicrobial peptide transport system permease subunit